MDWRCRARAPPTYDCNGRGSGESGPAEIVQLVFRQRYGRPHGYARSGSTGARLEATSMVLVHALRTCLPPTGTIPEELADAGRCGTAMEAPYGAGMAQGSSIRMPHVPSGRCRMTSALFPLT